jgi:pimeloyl-ACP methyl ester carboxylesterase
MIGELTASVDGRKVHARVEGETESGATPVVFVHGAGLDGSVWDPQVTGIAAAGFRTMAVDLPGHGASEGPALHTIEDLAVWTAGFLDAVDAPRAHLVGHSMGALIALELAAVVPARVASLALLGVAASMAVNPDLLAASERNDGHGLDQMSQWMHAREPDGPSGWGPAETLALLEQSEPGVVFSGLSACNNHGDVTVATAEVDAPTLLVLGGQDVMTRPQAATPIAEAIHDSRTIVIHGAGHMMMVERPQEVNTALLSFLPRPTRS